MDGSAPSWRRRLDEIEESETNSDSSLASLQELLSRPSKKGKIDHNYVKGQQEKQRYKRHDIVEVPGLLGFCEYSNGTDPLSDAVLTTGHPNKTASMPIAEQKPCDEWQ